MLIEQVVKRRSGAKVIVLGVADNPEVVTIGYLLQQESFKELEAQITAIAHHNF